VVSESLGLLANLVAVDKLPAPKCPTFHTRGRSCRAIFHKYIDMKKKDLHDLTDEELLIKKKKLKSSKIMYATVIGFLAGILIFGIVSWSSSSKNHLGFLIPMFIPIYIIYSLVKNSKSNKNLEEVLKERHLN
jgi:hypothetical protein